MFFTKTASTLRVKELRESELALVGHQSHLDYHGAMVAMYEGRVGRLREEVQRDEDEAQEKAKAAQEKAMSHG